MLRTSQIETYASGPYALPTDFCRLFEREMDRFYLLAYLLTADGAAAESCFVQGLEDATNSNRVFKDWADSWARRMIIQNAIQSLHPRPEDPRPGSGGGRNFNSHSDVGHPAMEAVAALPTLERFVFVMSALEHYSDQDCSLLLDCTRGEVIAARTRALEQIASSAQLSSERSGTESPQRAAAESATRRKATARLVFA